MAGPAEGGSVRWIVPLGEGEAAGARCEVVRHDEPPRPAPLASVAGAAQDDAAEEGEGLGLAVCPRSPRLEPRAAAEALAGDQARAAGKG